MDQVHGRLRAMGYQRVHTTHRCDEDTVSATHLGTVERFVRTSHKFPIRSSPKTREIPVLIVTGIETPSAVNGLSAMETLRRSMIVAAF